MGTSTLPYSTSTSNLLGLFSNQGTSSGHTPAMRFDSQNTRIDLLVTGTDCALGPYFSSSASNLRITVANADGSSPTITTPTLTTGAWQSTGPSLFSGKPEATYWVTIQGITIGQTLLDGTNFLVVTGAAPALAQIPTSIWGSLLVPLQSISSHIVVEPGFKTQTIFGYDCYKTFAISGNTVQSDGAIRFRLNTSHTGTLYLWAYNNAVNYHLDVYDATGATLQASFDVTGPGGGVFGPNLVTLATGIDNTTAHICRLTECIAGGNIVCGLITSGGAGIDQTWTPPTLASIGVIAVANDSIVAAISGTPNKSWLGFGRKLAAKCPGAGGGAAILNLGIPGNPISSTLDASAAMQLRTGDMAVTPNPYVIFAPMGENDVDSAGVGIPTATYQSAYTAIVNGFDSLGAGTRIYYMDVFPNTFGGCTQAHLDTYNPLAQAIVQAKGGRHRYIPTKNWNMGGAAYKTGGAFDGTLYADGQHFLPAGHDVIQAYLQAYAAQTNAYTVTASGSVVLGSPVTLTITICSGGKFDGNVPLVFTSSDGGALVSTASGATITGGGTSTLTVTPALGDTTFTVTYTPVSAGTQTVTHSTVWGWAVPSPSSFTVAAVIPTTGSGKGYLTRWRRK